MAVDQMVLATQNWLNDTYGSDTRFEMVEENGKTGWQTIYGLLRALQIELGIQETSNNFGPTTQKLFKSIKRNDGTTSNLFGIVQGALWCKGYNTGHYAVQVDGRNHVNCSFDKSVEDCVKTLEEDAGRSTVTGIVDLNLMKALLSMDSFVCITSLGGDTKIRVMQQYLNENYEDYIGLSPCDGIYGRTTNKALIYALQAEEGLDTNTANGNFGPSTRKYCPTIPYDNVATNNSGVHYNAKSISKFINILKICLYCNGYGDGNCDGTFTLLDDKSVRDFQSGYALSVNGIVNLGTWLSLLLSCGDTDRVAIACDTATKIDSAKALSLRNAGFKYIGRYITKVEGGLDKDLTRLEEEIIFNNGMAIFPIFQEYGGDASAFTYNIGNEDAQKAKNAAENLGIPHGTTIYFAVDFDPQQDTILSNIVPYFKGIYDYFRNSKIYKIGVYGTRNVCRILRNSNEIQIDNMFVADASYGFSGNLGFSIPTGWAFDQFYVDNYSVGNGEGKITVDKVAYSGKDNGYKTLDYTTIDESFKNISELYDLAMDYSGNNDSKSNELVLQYIRRNKYGNANSYGSGSDLMWKTVAGEIDEDFCNLADKNGHANDSFGFLDTKENVMNDFIHLAATLNSLIYKTGILGTLSNAPEEIIDIYAGWGGDAVTFSKNVKSYYDDTEISDYKSEAEKNICTKNSSYFTIEDYISDIDAINLFAYIKDGHTLPKAFNFYYSLGEFKKRTVYFINNIGGLSKFDDYCKVLKSDDYPIFQLALIGTISSEYKIVAIDSFNKFVKKQYDLENS